MIVLVAGGTGLLGSRVVELLEEEGHKVVVHHRGHKAVPTYADVIVNCVGIIKETPRQDFKAVHVGFPEWLCGLARKLGVRQFVQVSALGANLEGTPYQRTKRQGEMVVENSGLPYAIVRPSMMHGGEKAATQTFRRIARTGFFPLLANGKVQPVSVDTVARVVVAAAQRRIRNRTVDVAGPEAFTYASLAKRLHPGVRIIPLPRWLVSLISSMGRIVPGLPTPEMVAMMREDNVSRSRITEKLQVGNPEVR